MTKFPLNAQQQAVADWIVNDTGSLNLTARAGCGKTYTLLNGAIRAIVENGLGEVVFLVFNKANADETKVKLAAMAKDDPRFGNWKLVQASTVHSAGFSPWRRVAPKVKVDEKKVLSLIDARAAQDGPKSVYATCAPAIVKGVSLAKQAAFGLLHGISDQRAWYDLLEHHAVNDLADGWTLDEIVPAAVAILRASIDLDREVVDFDDMILAPLVHKARFWPKDWVLLDEAQDTNAARRALALALLKPKTGRLIAVGDDRQAIYGFTGADATAMDLIADALGSARLPLTVTYRCPKAVVAEANRLVPDLTAHETAPEGIVRTLPLTRAEPANDDGTIERTVYWFEDELPAPTASVLCRNTKPLVEQAYALLRKGIGCRVEGREIGTGLVKLATRWKRVTGLAALGTKLEDYRDREVVKWNAKGREERAQAVVDKVETLLVLSDALISEDKGTVAALVAFIESLFGDSRPGDRSNVLTLSTIHKAKGREWDTVYLLDRAGTLPSPWARKPWQLRQEENLEYVAITRAKNELVDLIA